MKDLQRYSYIDVIGHIWWPAGAVCATQIYADWNDVENMRDDDGQITRESVENWLSMRSGDFADIVDFFARIEDGPDTLDFPWSDEESEYIFNDCMFPAED